MDPQDRVRITVWSDYVCPFCYLEEPVLEQIQDAYGNRSRWNGAPLYCGRSRYHAGSRREYLHTTWNRAVYPTAERRGMALRLPPVQPRSRRVLGAAEFARERERFDEMHHALLRAFFEQGRDLGDIEVLLDVGGSVGLDPEKLRPALEQGRYTETGTPG